MLEDNLRCPSGVSYVLENRRVMKGLFPKIFSSSHVRPVSNYPSCLRNMLAYLAGDEVAEPRVVLLTLGFIIRLISNIPFSRNRWGSSWWKATT